MADKYKSFIQLIASQIEVGTPQDPGMANYTMYTTLLGYVDGINWLAENRSEVSAFWSKTYKGVVLERDLWDFTKDAYESKPDEKDDEVPFITDPHDIYDSWLYFNEMVEFLFSRLDQIQISLGTIKATLDGWKGMSPAVSAVIDGSALYMINAISTNPLTPSLFKTLIDNMNASYADKPTAFYAFVSTIGGLLDAYFHRELPDEKGYLVSLLESGLPAHQDVGKWWTKVLEDFDLDKDDVYGDPASNPTLNALGFATSSSQNQGGIKIDGMTITVEYEWLDGAYVDPKAAELEKRDDFDIVFTYSDTGGQSSVAYMKGDEVFYKKESLATAIPGYEISILLGAAAISAIGIIYVIMKKRRM
jgi:hypothetical protein